MDGRKPVFSSSRGYTDERDSEEDFSLLLEYLNELEDEDVDDGDIEVADVDVSADNSGVDFVDDDDTHSLYLPPPSAQDMTDVHLINSEIVAGNGSKRQKTLTPSDRLRLRSKFFLESLRAVSVQVMNENKVLREVVKDLGIVSDPPDPKLLVGSSLSDRSVLTDDADEDACNEDTCTGCALEKASEGLVGALVGMQTSFLITDPALPDNPIVYATPGVLELTGYTISSILGRNCRIFQGPGTSTKKKLLLKNSILSGMDVNVTLLNYSSTGMPFWNNIFIAPLFNAEREIVNFIAVLRKVEGPPQGDEEWGRADELRREDKKKKEKPLNGLDF